MIIEHELLIDAPPERVWAVTQDLERWPEWTPTVSSIERLDDQPFGLGSIARIQQPSQPSRDWTVTEFIPLSTFTWETRSAGLMMIATHELIDQGSSTKSVLRLNTRGILAVLLWPIIRSSINKALEQENAGLKSHCESLANP